MTIPHPRDPVTLAPAVEDNPRIPVKAIASALASTATLALTLGLDLDPWLVLVLTFVAAFGGAYVPRNPKRPRSGPPRNDKIYHRGPGRPGPKQ